MKVHPVNLERVGQDQLLITWSDGQQRRYAVAELRGACPCATCRERRSQPPSEAPLLPVIPAEEARPLSIEGMTPLGAYAYKISFSDGHDTGIYSYDLLRALGEQVE